MFILNEVEFVSALIWYKITKYGWFYNKIQMWIEKKYGKMEIHKILNKLFMVA